VLISDWVDDELIRTVIALLPDPTLSALMAFVPQFAALGRRPH
jgi:hypothetical protein